MAKTVLGTTGILLIVSGVLAIRMWEAVTRAAYGHPDWERVLFIGRQWSELVRLPQTAFFGVALIISGCCLIGLSFRCADHSVEKNDDRPSGFGLETPGRSVLPLIVTLAVSIVGFAVTRGFGWSSWWAVPSWLAMVWVSVVGLWKADRRLGVVLGPNLGAGERLVLALGTAVAGSVYLAIACSWRFSFIGDEFAFYYFARGIAADGLFSLDWFNRMGVYGDSPIPVSVFQAFWIALLGESCLAWRLSAVILTVICLPPLYLVFKSLLRGPAMVVQVSAGLACVLFFSAEQIIVWAVEGKIHVAGLPAVAFGLCLVLAARARGSSLLYFAAGAVCGAGFHVSLLGVAVSVPCVGGIILLDLIATMCRDRSLSRRDVIPPLLFAAGVLLLAAPFMVQLDHLFEAANSKMVHFEGTDGFGVRFCATVIGLLQPLWFDARDHFLWGNVVDPITAVLVCLAFIPSSRKRNRSLLISIYVLVMSAIMMAGLSQYEYPAVTRTFMFAIPTVMLAALGLARLIPNRRLPILSVATAIVVTAAVFNWVKIWHFNPYQRYEDWHKVAIREVEMTSDDGPIAMVFPGGDPRNYLFVTMVELRRYDDRVLIVQADEKGLRALDRHLGSGEFTRVLHHTEGEETDRVLEVCIGHGFELEKLTRTKVTAPQQGALVEAVLWTINRVEGGGGE